MSKPKDLEFGPMVGWMADRPKSKGVETVPDREPPTKVSQLTPKERQELIDALAMVSGNKNASEELIRELEEEETLDPEQKAPYEEAIKAKYADMLIEEILKGRTPDHMGDTDLMFGVLEGFTAGLTKFYMMTQDAEPIDVVLTYAIAWALSAPEEAAKIIAEVAKSGSMTQLLEGAEDTNYVINRIRNRVS